MTEIYKTDMDQQVRDEAKVPSFLKSANKEDGYD